MIRLPKNFYIISVVNYDRKTLKSYCCTEHLGIGRNLQTRCVCYETIYRNLAI